MMNCLICENNYDLPKHDRSNKARISYTFFNYIVIDNKEYCCHCGILKYLKYKNCNSMYANIISQNTHKIIRFNGRLHTIIEFNPVFQLTQDLFILGRPLQNGTTIIDENGIKKYSIEKQPDNLY